jgi:predicted CxxxxCH...CXXCH cytochrome family protein
MAERAKPSTGLARLWLVSSITVSALVAGWSPACLERRETPESDRDSTGCTACHGDPARPGSALSRAAPPIDLQGERDVRRPGVGAHAVHLATTPTHAGIECGECHTVPARVDTPGHVDDGGPAEVHFGPLARHGARTPSYAAGERTCSESYCHGGARVVWTSPRAPAEICGSCHGLPPALPHPQSDRCFVCHGDVIDAERRFLSPERHLDGEVDFSLGDCSSCHGLPPPAPHPQIEDCSSCHGDAVAADDRTLLDRDRHVDGIVELSFDGDCTACHGDTETGPAPPRDLRGSSASSAPGVGAHETHVLGTERSRAVPCSECHLVPREPFASGHLDSLPPAELVFSGVALANGASPRYENGSCQMTSCHGAVLQRAHASGGSNTTPVWTEVDGSQTECGSCHAIPPPAPHPLPDSYPCHACHFNLAEDDVTFIRPDLHVDGVVTLQVE